MKYPPFYLSGVTFIILFFTLPVTTFAQQGVLTVGLHYRQMFPASYLNISETEDVKDFMRITTSPPTGSGFGMPIRWGITDFWSAETGIYFNRRYYDIAFSDVDTGFEENVDFTIVSYEVPILPLANIQLTEQVFMNVGAGASVDMFASDVQSEATKIYQVSWRSNWIQMAILGTLGVEYRTENDGMFYLGGSFHRPFTTMFITQVNYQRSESEPWYFINTSLAGTYLSVDVRYFFPASSKKRGARN